MSVVETSPAWFTIVPPLGDRTTIRPRHPMPLSHPVDGVGHSSAMPQSLRSDPTMPTPLSALARLRLTPLSSLRLNAHRSSRAAALPSGLVQHVFSRPARIRLFPVMGAPRPRRPTKNALHYVPNDISATARQCSSCRTVSIAPSSRSGSVMSQSRLRRCTSMQTCTSKRGRWSGQDPSLPSQADTSLTTSYSPSWKGSDYADTPRWRRPSFLRVRMSARHNPGRGIRK
jgi:hypothetical protein